MKIALSLTSALDGKQRTIFAAFPDFIAFENKYNRSVAKFEAELTLTDLAYLGWHAEKRLKKTGLDFESWWDCTFSVAGRRTTNAVHNVGVPSMESHSPRQVVSKHGKT